jgi:flavodoxin
VKKILIVYLSRTGNTEKMAEFIAEGIRMTGNTVEVKRLSKINSKKDLESYDGFVFGCPTYYRNITDGMKRFLFIAASANLVGKVGGAFGSYIYSGESGDVIYETMLHVFKMDMVDLGALNMKEHIMDTDEGIHACQDYGKTVGKKFD